MESANLQLPGDQLVGSPPNLAAPSCFGFGSNLAATWSSSSAPTTTFTNDGIVSINSSTRQKISSDHHHNSILVSDVHINPLSNASTSCDNLVDQDLGFSSNQTAANYNDQLARIKEELSEISFPKFTELLNSPSNSDIDVYANFPFKADNLRCLSCCSSSRNSTGTDHNPSPLMVKSLSSSCPINGPLFDHSDSTGTAISSSGFGGGLLALQGCRGRFSQVNPTVNISNLSQYSLMGMNGKPGFDHLASSARFYNMVGTVNGQPNLGTFGVDPIQQLHSKTISSFNGEITETKRPSSLMEPKTSSHIKKSRLESRTSSCPPFKVRKEKLGDRIAALQQLVSPFGKTDTASVLMEAIGYIKFLQSQVETLSVPYMKSSRNKSSKTMQGGQKDQDGNVEEPKRDLKSRGLCLVPLSCMSYVTGDGGAGSIWPPVPNFDSAGRIT